jgi:hypothetical protein
MKIFILITALLSTLLWINILFAELITVKINPYITQDDKVQKQRAMVKNILIIIMSVFWGTYIHLYL